MDIIKRHTTRFFLPIRSAEPSEYETQTLEESTSNNKALRSFYVWRRSSILIACPIVFISMLIAFVALGRTLGPDSVFSGLGTMLVLLHGLTDMFLFVGMTLSLFWWNKMIHSTKALGFGWLASFTAPLLPVIFPFEYVIDRDLLDQIHDSDIALLKVNLTLGYFITLLPVLVTFPGSTDRGSLRVRSLFPNCPNTSLPGWILFISALIYSFLIYVALILTQVGGNFLLLLATFSAVTRPWVFMVQGGLFVDSSTPEVENKISRLLLISTCIGLTEILLIAIWALSAEVSGVRVIGEKKSDYDNTMYLIDYNQAAQLLFETIGRIIITAVVFSDCIVSMVLRDWEEATKKEDQLGEVRFRDFEDFKGALYPAKTATKADTESGDVLTNVEAPETWRQAGDGSADLEE